jgi:hypothetical protein
MSDEAHFHLLGFVNQQNFRYRPATKPKEFCERPLRSSKVTVWFGIIGSYHTFQELKHRIREEVE